MTRIQNQYTPDYVSPPGETLLELIEEREISQAELSRRMGRPKKTINEIIQGKTAITPETALQLERVLNVPANFWNRREQQYRQHLAYVNERERLSSQVEWIKKFPIKAMISFGWIESFEDKIQQLKELLKFFGVASPEQWEKYWNQCSVAFRKTSAFQSDLEALAAWLRQGEIESQKIECQPYDSKKFREVLEESRQLTIEPPDVFQEKLVCWCATAGVSVVFVPQVPKARVSGATRWLTPKKAVIQLSLRYKKDDHLWFSFFHEAGHILFHSKRDIFLENDEVNGKNEEEANDFAARILIPPTKFAKFLRQHEGFYSNKRAIKDFAKEIGIAPGIVVGRLQHDRVIPYSHCNDLKRTFIWGE
ncbi:MAG: helix-turn-helix domain-containing protein [Anaerolineales bacterium]|nr:helix-turn-helix domain-containing protein [Anaerolineales bacterium]